MITVVASGTAATTTAVTASPTTFAVGVRRDADGDDLGNNGGHAHRSGYVHDAEE